MLSQILEDTTNHALKANRKAEIVETIENFKKQHTEFKDGLPEARQEQEQIMKETRVAMEQERIKSLQQIQDEIAAIAILATSKIIGQHVDETTNNLMFSELLKEVGEGQ